jgi:beta-lactamase class D OXA-2
LVVKGKPVSIRIFAILFSLLTFILPTHAQEKSQERADWEKYFTEFNANGTIVVADERANNRSISVYDEARAKQRYSPASTFKIPHTLMALDAGAVRDEFQTFRWDGVARSFAAHNQDQDLRSAMRNSTIWVYEAFAKKIGEDKNKDRTRDYLRKLNYGNADPTTARGNYWVDGNLAISAHEQISMLKKLYRNELPFRVEHQRLVKDIMIVEAGRDWILRAKTGWEGRMGWWVGWIESPTGPVFFALNIDTPNRMSDLSKREDIVRAILRSIKALPSTN